MSFVFLSAQRIAQKNANVAAVATAAPSSDADLDRSIAITANTTKAS